MKNKIAQLWTASIAYIALAVGAGLSIMYNVVDTITVRGAAMDIYDWITAIAAPGLVVLMVELFVSRWWIGRPWYMQLVRTLAVLVIGGVAMRTSWTHGHDFMSRRGQAADVAVMWPLAIDLLAVMATALILAGRRTDKARTDTDTGRTTPDSQADTDTKPRTPDMDMPATVDNYDEPWDMSADPVATRPDGDLSAWTSGYERALDVLSAGVGDEAEAYVRAATATLPQRTRMSAGSAPQEFVDMAQAWDPGALPRADMVKLSAAHFGVHPRTVSRWLNAFGAE